MYNFFFNLLIYLFSILRKLSRSFAKKEILFQDLITFLKYKKKNIYCDKNNFEDFEKYFVNLKNYKKLKLLKVKVCISFYYNKDKIKKLIKVCKNLFYIFKEIDLTIITNNKSFKIYKNQFPKIKNSKSKITMYFFSNKLDPRIMPWAHFNIMKKAFVKNKYTHYLYIEDDILITKRNINYWLSARVFLNKFNLIPGFIRSEFNYTNKKLYAVDNYKKQFFFIKPKIFSKKKNIAFINTSFPYHAMYFYDQELMREHLFGVSSNPDYGHGSHDINYLNPKLINLSLLEKANIGLIYKNLSNEFLNRSVIAVKFREKQLYKYCLIKHLTNKYTNQTLVTKQIPINGIFF